MDMVCRDCHSWEDEGIPPLWQKLLHWGCGHLHLARVRPPQEYLLATPEHTPVSWSPSLHKNITDSDDRDKNPKADANSVCVWFSWGVTALASPQGAVGDLAASHSTFLIFGRGRVPRSCTSPTRKLVIFLPFPFEAPASSRFPHLLPLLLTYSQVISATGLIFF
jgi:hypothetical protein